MSAPTLERAATAAPRTPIFAVMDVETTGLAPPSTVIELGWAGLFEDGHQLVTSQELFHPGDQIITPENRAIHKIDPADLVGKPVFDADALYSLSLYPLWVAHNAAFERQFIDPLVDHLMNGESLDTPPRWICTRKCAMHIWPDLASHSNQALRYALALPNCNDPRFDPPHRALPDALVTAEILKILLTHASAEQLVEWTAQLIIYQRMPWGKHKGEAIASLDRGYLKWLGGINLDVDMRASVDAEIARRRVEGGYQ